METFKLGTRVFRPIDPLSVDWPPGEVPPNPEDAGAWKSGSLLMVSYTEPTAPDIVRVILTSKQNIDLGDVAAIIQEFFPHTGHAAKIMSNKHVAIWGRLYEEESKEPIGEVETYREPDAPLLTLPDRPRKIRRVPDPVPSGESGGSQQQEDTDTPGATDT